MKIKDIRGEDSSELMQIMKTLQQEAFKLSFRTNTEGDENPARSWQIRRAVARIKTVLHERTAEKAKSTAEKAKSTAEKAKQTS